IAVRVLGPAACDLGAEAAAAAAVSRAPAAPAHHLLVLPQLREPGGEPAHPAAFRDGVEPAEFPARQLECARSTAARALSRQRRGSARTLVRAARPGALSDFSRAGRRALSAGREPDPARIAD